MGDAATLRAVLQRHAGGDEGTPGVLTLGEHRWYTLELPWRGNTRSKSCIPSGTYRCGPVNSPRFGDVYGVHDVPGRSHILIHAGNHAGDVDIGLRSDVEGCILLGTIAGSLWGQRAVLRSRIAVTAFLAAAGGREIELEIRE